MVQVEAEKKGGSDADETAAGCAERAHFFQSAVEAALLGTKYQQTGMYYSSLRSKQVGVVSARAWWTAFAILWHGFVRECEIKTPSFGIGDLSLHFKTRRKTVVATL